MQTNTPAAFRFDLFGERFSNLTFRVQALREQFDILSAYSHDESSGTLSPERLTILESYLQLNKVGSFADRMELAQPRVQAIRPQLSASVIVLQEILSEIELSLQRIGDFLQQGNLSPAAASMVALEAEWILPCEQVVRKLLQLVDERISERGFVHFNMIDLLVKEIFDSVFTGLDEERSHNGEFLPLYPIFTSEDQLTLMQSWNVPQLQFARFGKTLPLAVLERPFGLNQERWDTVRYLQPIARQLYQELGVDYDIQMLLTQCSHSNLLSPSALTAATAWRREIVAEICATLMAGPAYVGSMIEGMAYTQQQVVHMSMDENGAPTYLRWCMMLATLRVAGYSAEADSYASVINATYGTADAVSAFASVRPVFTELVMRSNDLVRIVLETPMSLLGSRRLRDVLPMYSLQMHGEALQITECLLEAADVNSGLAPLTQNGHKAGADSSKEEKTKTNSKAKKGDSRIGMIAKDASILCSVSGCHYAFKLIGADPGRLQGLRYSCNEFSTVLIESVLKRHEQSLSKTQISAEGVQRLSRRLRGGSRAYTTQYSCWL